MIYNKDVGINLFIPRNSVEDYTGTEELSLTLYSVSTGEEYVFNTYDTDNIYYYFSLDLYNELKQIKNGDYKYFLTLGQKMLSEGLLKIKNNKKDEIIFDNTKKDVIYYE